jgi:hypothetical protein
MNKVDEIIELLKSPDLSRLEQHLEYKDSIINSFTKRLREHEERINAVGEYIKQCSSSGDLTKELEHVAELLDITLVNKYDVTITVKYRGTIEIPMSEDIDDYHNHIRFEFSDPFTDEWNVDIYEDDIEINYDDVSWKD